MQQIISKFGGTSVSSRETWDNIASIAKTHIKEGLQPIIVCSALTQISNLLEKAIEAALSQVHDPIEKDIIKRHEALAQALEVDFNLIEEDLRKLHLWLHGISLLNEAPAKTRAQILSLG